MAAYLVILNGALRDGPRFVEPRQVAERAVNKLGGNILARSVNIRVHEGDLQAEHMVVIGFPNGKQLRKYLQSPEYEYIKSFREDRDVCVLLTEDR